MIDKMDREIRVLLVDDHAMFRAGLGSILRDQPDVQVVGEAADGMEAVEKTGELMPDIVLMDLSMPRMGGLEATRLIKKHFPDVGVLILTMHTDSELFSAAIESGASGYVVKEAEPRHLISSIKAAYKQDTQKVVLDSWKEELDLLIAAPVNAATIVRFTEELRQTCQAQVLATTGTWSGGTTVRVILRESIPMKYGSPEDMLRKVPIVKEVRIQPLGKGDDNDNVLDETTMGKVPSEGVARKKLLVILKNADSSDIP